MSSRLISGGNRDFVDSGNHAELTEEEKLGIREAYRLTNVRKAKEKFIGVIFLVIILIIFTSVFLIPYILFLLSK